MTLNDLHKQFPNEEAARAWFERARWPDGPVCPRCGLVGQAYWISTRRVWCCGGCKSQFTVTAGTPMHRTHLPLVTWSQAMWLISASSKGISAMKLAEWLGVAYQTAWHLGHRIRAMMAEDDPVLRGIVELDEIYAGAAPRKQAKPARDHGPDDMVPAPNTTGRGTKRPLVLVATERGGKVDARVIPTHGKTAIAEALRLKLAEDAVVMTDGLPAYKHFGKKHTHLSVNHSAREYARTDNGSGHRVHVNTAESFNSILRRAVTGVFHFISRKHLGRYACEASHRLNHRTMDVMGRLAGMVRNGDGRVLSYAFLTAGTR